jgi:hypothetical protein
MITHIYLIENIEENSNKVYIGKTKDSNKHNRKYTHKQTYGKQISFTIIDSVKSLNRKDWRLLESYWIEQFRQWGFKLDNKNKGGGGPEYYSSEIKDKMSKALIGQKRSQETRNKMSKASIGRKKSQEHRDKIKNRIISQKQIDNIRKAKCKAVIQYDKQGNYINEFSSLIEAANILKVNYQNLSQHTRGYKGCNKTIGGYVFKQKR